MKNKTLKWQTKVGTITLCPLLGRILQVEIEGEQIFWTNPSYSGDWNIGGDRLWVAPEVDWNWKTLKKADFEKYEVPETVDPGNWKISKEDEGYCRISQDVSLNNQQRDSNIQIKLVRSFTSLRLQQEPFFLTQMAYQTDNELWIHGGTTGQKIGLWSLLQIPSGGKMYIKCQDKTLFRNYFTPIKNDLWQKQGNLLELDITGKNQYKIGVAPNIANGTIAYARKVLNGYLVVYRKFFPQPWRLYNDVPMNDLNGNGDVIQVYNDNGSFGGYGEMEYHSPSIQVGEGIDHIMDSSLTVIGLVSENKWPDWLNHWM